MNVRFTLEALAHLPYVIVHELQTQSDEVVVLGLFHGAQDRESEPEMTNDT
jgi:hypothetical protein